MSQTFNIMTPDSVDTTKRAFPQSGVSNLKVIKNGEYKKVGLWINGTTVIAMRPLKIVGGKFTGLLSTGVVQNVVPTVIPVIDLTTVTLPNSTWNYLEVTIDDNKPFAFITMEYFVGDICVAGGTEDTEALIDYSSRPYFVGNLIRMFSNNRKIRYDLTKWNVNPVTNMSRMFESASAFNQDLNNWNVGNVSDFASMFRNAKSFNKPVSNWNMSKATTINGIFFGATPFDQDVDTWNLSSCTSFGSAFRETSFNRPLSDWDVSKGTEFGGMFWLNSKFNQPLSMWNVSSATDMLGMFRQATAFNQNISNWNISKVTDMNNMFNGATSYNQDLSAWCTKFNINVNLANFLDNSGMSAANYSAFLNALWTDIGTTRQSAWVARTTAKILGAANLKYNSTAAAARASLVANGWTITDGGQAV